MVIIQMKADSANKLVKISSVIKKIYGDELHQKRQLSIAKAVILRLFVALINLNRQIT